MSKAHPLQRAQAAAGPLAALVAAAVAATGCSANQDSLRPQPALPWVGEGARVVGFSGSYSFRDTGFNESERFSARATIEEFLADEHSVGAFALGQFANVSSDADGREQIWTGAHYHYHLHFTERTSIYAGPVLGLTFFDDERSSQRAFSFGVSSGLRHWISERAAFTVEPTYLRARFDDDAGGDSDEFLVLWGLALSL